MNSNKPPLEMVIYNMVEDCGRQKTAIAADMGKPLSTFSREVSPYDEVAKLGASDIIPLSNACNSDAVIEWLADARGYRLIPKDARPDGADMNEEINQAWEAAGAFLTRARNGAARGAASAMNLLGLRRRVAKEMDDVMARAMGKQDGDV